MDVLFTFCFVLLFPVKAFCDQVFYYIAAQNDDWDYAPSDRNLVTEDQTLANNNLEYDPANQKYGHVYRKIRYKEYTDDTFTTRKNSPDYLGFLGPVLKTYVGDELIVVFKNNASHDLSIHPHGIAYDKSNEGSAYGGRKGVSPGKTHRYTWNITDESGPENVDGCISHLYHSDVNFVRDVNTGLVGYILVCSKDVNIRLDEDIFIYVGITDENLSLMSKITDSKIESNRFHAINGYVYGNIPRLTLCLGRKIRFHIASLSTSDDLHAVRFFGQSFIHNRKRYDAIPVYSGSSLTAELEPPEIGTWLFTSTAKSHIERGMQTLVSVKECGEQGLIIDVKQPSKIRKYYIAAEEIQWNGQNRFVFTEYTDRRFNVKVPRPPSEEYLGTLGPLVRVEVGDIVKIVFYNKLNDSLFIRPSGLRTHKQYEGYRYNDSIPDKIEMSHNEKRTIYWFVPEYYGPWHGDDPCIMRYYTTGIGIEHTTLVGPIMVCQQGALDEKDQQVIGGMDFFLILQNDKVKDINGYNRSEFPMYSICSGTSHRLHMMSIGSKADTLLSKGDPFNVDGKKKSLLGLVSHMPMSVRIQPVHKGLFEVISFPNNALGISFNVTDCGRIVERENFTEATDITYLGIDLAPWYYDFLRVGDRKWKEQQTGINKMRTEYKKAVYVQYYPGYVRWDTTKRLAYQGFIGHIFRTRVNETLKISLKNNGKRNFTIFSPGIISDFTEVLSSTEAVNITWKIPRSIGPGPNDPECIVQPYFSSVDTERDITAGLIGPVIICKEGVKDNNHIIIFFGEIDESRSWYFEENVKKSLPDTDVNLEDPDFINNNKIRVINGVSEGILADIQASGTQLFIHFLNMGFKFQTIHLPGIMFPEMNNDFIGKDVVGLHPGTSTSIKLSPKVTGKWRLTAYGTEMHWNKMSAIINVPSNSGGAK